MTDAIDDLLVALDALAATHDPRVVAAAYRGGLTGADQLKAHRRRAARQLVQAIRRAIAQPNGRP